MVKEEYGKTLKCTLKSILKKSVDYGLFLDCISRANDICFICYNFINCYILYLFKNDNKIPDLNKDFIRIAFKALSKKSSGPRPKGKQLKLFNDLNAFFSSEFIKLITNDKKVENIDDYKFDSTNLSYIFNLYSTEMTTSYTNNIKLNFFKYVNQFVNESFIEKTKTLTKDEYSKLSEYDKIIYRTDKKKDNELIKIIKKELNYVKNDLIDGTFTSDEKYHKWINENKNIIFPKLEKDISAYENDIKISHNKYLKHMLEMNKFLEEKGKKLFSSVCLRTEATNKYVHIDTSVLKDIFGEVNSGMTNKEIWEKYFDINLKKLKLKGYTFNFMISTDGTAVSINFIRNDKIETKNKKIKAKANASKKARILMKNKTEEEKEKIKEEKKKLDLENSKKKQEENNKKKEKLKEEFKKLLKEEQNEIKLKMKLKKNKYEYIEDAVKNDLLLQQLKEAFNKGNIKTGDPGKRAPITLLGKPNKNIEELEKAKTGKVRKNNILFSYSSGRRIVGTKRKKYGNLINNKKKKTKIESKTVDEYEKELSKYNSKSVDYDNFKIYAKLKMKMRKLVKDTEYNTYLRKLKWFGYINKRRHEDEILNEIEKVYGKDSIFVIGDWGDKGKTKRISMPNKGIKKMLNRRFDVYLIDEYNTSKLNHKTEEEGKNLKLKLQYMKEKKKYETEKEMHSILTFKMGNKGSGCINRDYNACMNMMKIVKELVKTKRRPEKYERKKKEKH